MTSVIRCVWAIWAYLSSAAVVSIFLATSVFVAVIQAFIVASRVSSPVTSAEACVCVLLARSGRFACIPAICAADPVRHAVNPVTSLCGCVWVAGANVVGLPVILAQSLPVASIVPSADTVMFLPIFTSPADTVVAYRVKGAFRFTLAVSAVRSVAKPVRHAVSPVIAVCGCVWLPDVVLASAATSPVISPIPWTWPTFDFVFIWVTKSVISLDVCVCPIDAFWATVERMPVISFSRSTIQLSSPVTSAVRCRCGIVDFDSKSVTRAVNKAASFLISPSTL